MGLKLFNLAGGVSEVMLRLAGVEAEVQNLVEAHMETMLDVRFLAGEYVIDCADGGRIDSLGLDENGAPVIVEYKRCTDAGVINQGLYYMAWLTNHKDAFRNLVRARLGASAASQILWSAPQLICVAGDSPAMTRMPCPPPMRSDCRTRRPSGAWSRCLLLPPRCEVRTPAAAAQESERPTSSTS